MQRILKPELKIAASAALIQRGCVILIGLDQIRVQAAGRWEKMRASIYAHLESLLRQKLGPADYYAQVDDLSFLVSLPSATTDEARILCLRVAHELHTNLLGHCEIGQLRIARATALDGDVLQCDAVAGAELARLAHQAIYSSVSETPGGTGAAALPGAAKSGQAIKYVPLWDAQNEAVTTYRCVGIGEQSIFGCAPAQTQFKADLSALLTRLRVATLALSTRLSSGERFLMSFPIPFDVLSSPVARMEIASLCRGLSATLRPYLQFEISELPYGVPQSRLSELVGSLRPFCRGVWGHLPPRIPSYGAYQGAGLQAIGLSLAPSVAGTSEMGSEIFKMCAAAQRIHIKSFLSDIPSLDALLSARDWKVSMMSGPLIGEPADAPSPVSRLTLHDILKRAAQLGAIGELDLRCAM